MNDKNRKASIESDTVPLQHGASEHRTSPFLITENGRRRQLPKVRVQSQVGLSGGDYRLLVVKDDRRVEQLGCAQTDS